MSSNEDNKDQEGDSSSSSTSSASTTPQILTRSMVATLIQDLDASDVLECYALVRKAPLQVGSGGSGNNNNNYYGNSTLVVSKMALGLRYLPPSNSKNNKQTPKPKLELTLEYGPQRLDNVRESTPLVQGGGGSDDSKSTNSNAAGGGSKSSSSGTNPSSSSSSSSFVTWENQGRIYYTTSLSASHYNGAYYMASVTGAVLESILYKAVEYPTLHGHRRYQPFSVYLRPPPPQQQGTPKESSSQQQQQKPQLLLKSSSATDFVREMFHHMAQLGVELQPILAPPMYQIRLWVSAPVEKVQVGVSTPAAAFYSHLYQCLHALVTGDYTYYTPTLAPTMSNMPSTTPTESQAPSHVPTNPQSQQPSAAGGGDELNVTLIPTMPSTNVTPLVIDDDDNWFNNSTLRNISASWQSDNFNNNNNNNQPNETSDSSSGNTPSPITRTTTLAPSAQVTSDKRTVNPTSPPSSVSTPTIAVGTNRPSQRKKTIAKTRSPRKAGNSTPSSIPRRTKETMHTAERLLLSSSSSQRQTKSKTKQQHVNNNSSTPITSTTTFPMMPTIAPTLTTTNPSMLPAVVPSVAPTSIPHPQPQQEEEQNTAPSSSVDTAQKAAEEAKEAAEVAHNAAKQKDENATASAAEAAATAAQKAADATFSAANQHAREGLLSGDGDLMTSILASTCFSNPLYEITKRPIVTTTTTTINSTTANSGNNSTSNNQSNTNPPPPSTTFAYLYIDGSFYYRLKMTAPYVDLVQVQFDLPQASSPSGVGSLFLGNGSGGDLLDRALAVIIVFALLLGVTITLQALGLRINRPLLRWQRRFFQPQKYMNGGNHVDNDDSVRGDMDDDELDNYGDDDGSTDAAIPTSMGGKRTSWMLTRGLEGDNQGAYKSYLSRLPAAPRERRNHNGTDIDDVRTSGDDLNDDGADLNAIEMTPLSVADHLGGRNDDDTNSHRRRFSTGDRRGSFEDRRGTDNNHANVPNRFGKDPDLVDLPHLKSMSKVAVPASLVIVRRGKSLDSSSTTADDDDDGTHNHEQDRAAKDDLLMSL